MYKSAFHLVTKIVDQSLRLFFLRNCLKTSKVEFLGHFWKNVIIMLIFENVLTLFLNYFSEKKFQSQIVISNDAGGFQTKCKEILLNRIILNYIVFSDDSLFRYDC